jgi:putative tricarboxylic transport membrane protein
MFDVLVMFVSGILAYLMRRRDYPIAPVTLGLILGGMMDSEFRRAVSLASSEDNMIIALFGRPITISLLILTFALIVYNLPFVKSSLQKISGIKEI